MKRSSKKSLARRSASYGSRRMNGLGDLGFLPVQAAVGGVVLLGVAGYLAYEYLFKGSSPLKPAVPGVAPAVAPSSNLLVNAANAVVPGSGAAVSTGQQIIDKITGSLPNTVNGTNPVQATTISSTVPVSSSGVYVATQDQIDADKRAQASGDATDRVLSWVKSGLWLPLTAGQRAAVSSFYVIFPYLSVNTNQPNGWELLGSPSGNYFYHDTVSGVYYAPVNNNMMLNTPASLNGPFQFQGV